MRWTALILAAALLHACDSKESSPGTPDGGPSDSLSSDVPAPVVDGRWELLGPDARSYATRLHGAAWFDGALFVSIMVSPDNRIDVVRFSMDGQREPIALPTKVQNTVAARLVASKTALYLVVPVYLGGNRIAVYRLEDDAFVEAANLSTTARTLTPIAVTTTGDHAAVAFVDGDGTIVVTEADESGAWGPVGTPIPWAGGESFPTQLSLAVDRGVFLLGFGQVDNQELRATVFRSTGAGPAATWEQLGPAGIDGALGVLDVAWHEGAPHFLRSIPSHRLLRWDGEAWTVVIEGVAGDEFYDLRGGAGGLHWMAYGGNTEPGIARLHAGQMVRLSSTTTTDTPAPISAVQSFPMREIIATGDELFWVYEDNTGNLYRVYAYRYRPAGR